MFYPRSTTLFSAWTTRLWRGYMLSFALGVLTAAPTLGIEAQSATALNGLPLTRFYPFDDVGDISRGAQLLFDPAGRLAVLHDGVFLVLNDDAWLNLEIQSSEGTRVQCVEVDDDGTYYYASLGSWGILSPTENGVFTADPFTPENSPQWATTSSFSKIVCRADGIYFAGSSGVAFWNRTTRETTFIEIPSVAHAFTLAGHIYISSNSLGTLRIDAEHGTFHEADRSIFGSFVIDHVAPVGDQQAVMSTNGRRLLFYDGERLGAMVAPLGERLPSRVTALQSLSDDKVALAINGHGVYIISRDGNIVTALTQPEYRAIRALATTGDGVLWASTENGILKVFYGAPVTAVGQALGLPVGWPQIVLWEGRTVMASNGRVYEAIPGGAGDPVHFQLIADQPAAGAWGISVWNEWLLLANTEAVFAARSGEPFQRIFDGVGRLAMLGSDICLAIGEKEIGALRFDGVAWRECAPRVPGMGAPSIVHSSSNAVWVEIGGNRAGRIEMIDGQIKTRVYDRFPWRAPQWVNISIVGDTAIMSGAVSGRIYVDEQTGEQVERPSLRAMLNEAPYWVARISEDAAGRLWASHAHGVFTLTPAGHKYIADTETYRLITEHRPLVQPHGKDVWISSGRSLYHADTLRPSGLGAPLRPKIVSVRDTRTNRELLGATIADGANFHLPYSQNSFAFRFFAGNYASRRTPDYEFRLNDDHWTTLDSSSVLRLSDLREGSYTLAIRLVDVRGPIGGMTEVNFSIAPPWHRTWYAFVAYILFGVAVVYGLIRLFLHRARVRHTALEKIVERRTEQLRTTMEQLQRETRIAATLAERNRLAGEIHDSLEQGFSGIVLHLDTTAGLAACPPPIQSALAVARNMLTFSRNEVRHAVWDLHSPLLTEGGLEPALKHLVAQSVPDPTRAAVSLKGEPRPLGSTIEHHLLRIAQEAVANAVKHAEAERLHVELTYTPSNACLTVHDDGRGFETDTVIANPQNGHFGLRSLRGRAAKIGAALEITSKPGHGTRITVCVRCAATAS